MGDSLLEVMQQLLAKGMDPQSKEQELWAQFGQTCAITVIDSTGFTRTTKKYGIIYTLCKLMQMRAIVLPILKKWRCQDYINEADSIIARFSSVDDAVQAVLQANQALVKEKLMLNDHEPFRICTGIGYGSLLITGARGEFFGAEMNLASKLGEDRAKAGELLLTDAAFLELDKDKQSLFTRRSCTVNHWVMHII
ncbi:MAG: hypothetical protein R8M38_01385 [Mariprofundaceae bacterium]